MQQEAKKYTCGVCGEDYEPDMFCDDYGQILIKYNMCHNCNHWRSNYEADKNPERHFAIINSEHYVLCPHTDGYLKGFGGHKVYIKFHNGDVCMCDNLWHQGTISSFFRDKMPDNAVFISKEEYYMSFSDDANHDLL